MMETKKQLRTIYKQMRDSLPEDTLSAGSLLIHQKMFQSDEYQQAEQLFVYISMNSEVQTTPIIEHGWACGKRVAVPVVMENRQLCFIEICDWSGLKKNRYGIMEPVPMPDQILTGSEKTMIIVPGLIFSEQKYRIGYGGGYYDRYLTNHPIGLKIGIAFDFQILADIPSELYDIPMDKIVTEKRIIT